MKVYSYILRFDSGFAPNPFHGVLTLACCKPRIRKTAQVGDIVVGLSTLSERIVYAMRVAEKLTFSEYWADPRFSSKVPDMGVTSRVRRNGDNIYRPVGDGRYAQLPSDHSKPDGTENPESKADDLGGRWVLVASDFVYCGASGLLLPPELKFLKIGIGHRCNFTPQQINAVAQWFREQPRGLQGRPSRWRGDDQTLIEALDEDHPQPQRLRLLGRGCPESNSPRRDDVVAPDSGEDLDDPVRGHRTARPSCSRTHR